MQYSRDGGDDIIDISPNSRAVDQVYTVSQKDLTIHHYCRLFIYLYCPDRCTAISISDIRPIYKLLTSSSYHSQSTPCQIVRFRSWIDKSTWLPS